MGNETDPAACDKEGWSPNTVDSAAPGETLAAAERYAHHDPCVDDPDAPTVYNQSAAVAHLNDTFTEDGPDVLSSGVMQTIGESIADKAVEVSGKLDERIEQIAGTAKNAGRLIASTAKKHPTAFLLTGAGIGWILWRSCACNHNDRPPALFS